MMGVPGNKGPNISPEHTLSSLRIPNRPRRCSNPPEAPPS